MGCAPSSGNLQVANENENNLIRQIEHLKQRQQTQDQEIDRLQVENEKLRQGQVNSGYMYQSTDGIDNDDDDHQMLVKEIEKLRLEQKDRNKEISDLREKNKQINQQLAQSFGNPLSPAKPKAVQQKAKNLPKVGDPVLAMWVKTPWQYFTATIVSFDVQELKYTIIWDDQDPSGRVVEYCNLALDRIPEPEEVAIGSIVLFPQGKYRGQEGVRLGGQRYHQGQITHVYQDRNGEKLFDGKHTKGASDGKWVTYSGYEPGFSGVKLSDLRISPNVLDILGAQEDTNDQDGGEEDNYVIDPCDVFISYTKVNSPSAIRNQEVTEDEAPPSYDQAILERICDPRDIKYHIEGCGVRVNEELRGSSLLETVKQINNAKVFVACLSDEYVKDEICRQEFQYAKKTVKKPVIPIVVGSGSFDWMMTVVGLLIAGEVYIHFRDKDVQEAKMEELLNAVKKNVKIGVPDSIGNSEPSPALAAQGSLGPADVFISYCWSNSETAFNAKQVSNAVGSSFADPRKIHEDLTRNGKFSLWIDTERLRTTSQNDDSMGMFEQIAEGLGKAKVVLVFVSKQYANSENCRMEVQFAIKSLKKPVVPVIVGSDNDWQSTVVGLLVASQENRPINIQEIQSSTDYEQKLQQIQQSILPLLGYKEETSKYSAPRRGDHVICHHQQWAYYYATIVSFDKESMSYTVDWDDGDPTGRVTSYKDLAIDEVPSEDQVGTDSIVFFPQGGYGATQGNNAGGLRFHQGVVTRAYKDHSGVTLYDGHHTKGEADQKWVTYRGYEYNFTGVALKDIRMSPNAMDALMACKQAFLAGE